MTQPVLVKTISVIVVNKRGRLLALRRNRSKKWYPGKWDIISGKLHPDETPAACLARELREEIGVSNYLVCAQKKPYIYTEKGNYWQVYPFLVKIDNAKVTLSNEHTSCRWIDLPDFLKMNVPQPLRRELAVFYDIPGNS